MAEPRNTLQPEDIEEIRRAARKAATTLNKEWLLAQLRGAQSDRRNSEEPSDSDESEELIGGHQEGSEETEVLKKSRSVASNDGKKALKRRGDGDKPKAQQVAHSAPARSRSSQMVSRSARLYKLV
ncbi:hypothetical protein NDU88_000602 [Pleurodeles waltl]|uniref:Uncharacterized protein n=1 Tax=Pleurodeles waltl TaxID=8319 RepID=A0AAV7P8Q8_PLEWA|nr:hypothetical protein NDU88_000602 [Pleurodeles waltl]